MTSSSDIEATLLLKPLAGYYRRRMSTAMKRAWRSEGRMPKWGEEMRDRLLPAKLVVAVLGRSGCGLQLDGSWSRKEQAFVAEVGARKRGRSGCSPTPEVQWEVAKPTVLWAKKDVDGVVCELVRYLLKLLAGRARQMLMVYSCCRRRLWQTLAGGRTVAGKGGDWWLQLARYGATVTTPEDWCWD